MRILLKEDQYLRLIENEEVSERLVRNITNLTQHISSVLNNVEEYKKQSDIDVIDYGSDNIVIAYKDETLEFTFDNEIEETPYYTPGTYDDPPEGSDGYWLLIPQHLRYTKDFEGEEVVIYDGKDFTKFVEHLPSWIDDDIQEIYRRNYDSYDRYDF